MTFLVPIMLFGWVPFTIFLFFRLQPHRAVIVSIIGGLLFLPMAAYDIPGYPEYSKNTAISLGLILGGRLSGKRKSSFFQWNKYDIPIILWCLCPILSSLLNDLGLYNGFSEVFEQVIVWGIPYLAGRIYFDTYDKLNDLCLSFIIGGLIYMPLCLFEVRMSPQLSSIIYGFFPHRFSQFIRYGGFRPIVFMQHALMVSLWMAITATIAFWSWRSQSFKSIKGIPIAIVFILLCITTIFCKSVNGIVLLLLGCSSYYFFKLPKKRYFFNIVLILVAAYPALRITGAISSEKLTDIVTSYTDESRGSSFSVRLLEEDLFIQKVIKQPLFGFGNMQRAWPRNERTGRQEIRLVDALWLITLCKMGLWGVYCLFSSLLIGPILIFNSNFLQYEKYGFSIFVLAVLSLSVIFFCIDSLLNSMVNPIYILSSGAILSSYINLRMKYD